MIPFNIEEEHILKAIEEIDANRFPEKRDSRNYVLVYKGRNYPPKYVVTLANKYANGFELGHLSFNGGSETNGFLESLGFTIKLKKNVNIDDQTLIRGTSYKHEKTRLLLLPRQLSGTPLKISDRPKHLNIFYSLLYKLKEKVEGPRRLAESHGRMDWPRQGVYFFFEDGEIRENGKEMRVVRVGTHAVSKGSRTTLWNRLIAHRGHMGGNHVGGGNHRGSVFRRHVGDSIIRKEDLDCQTWAVGSSAPKDIRDREYPVELKVSEHIGAMPFLWLQVVDEAGPRNIRSYIERNSVALLSNFNRNSIAPPSMKWLGLYSPNENIRKSGLWNVNFVSRGYDPTFLEALEQLIKDM